MLPAFYMLECSASYVCVSWFREVWIWFSRYTEVTQAASGPSFLFEPPEYSESRSKYTSWRMFTYIYNAGGLLIHLVYFSVFLNLWTEIWIFCLFCNASKAGNGHIFPYSYFSQRRINTPKYFTYGKNLGSCLHLVSSGCPSTRKEEAIHFTSTPPIFFYPLKG